MEHEELTRKIIGCAMAVHSAFGNGFQEVIYQRALAIEMAGKMCPPVPPPLIITLLGFCRLIYFFSFVSFIFFR